MPNAMTFTVVQYNAFARPYVVSHDGQAERMELIPEALAQLNGGDVDVITLCEVDFQVGEGVPYASLTDTRNLTDELLARFDALGFSHATRVLDAPRATPAMLNGGVIVVSRWPIVQTNSVSYTSFDGTDGLAKKGSVYVAVSKSDGGTTKTFHVFATHMQAWYSEAARSARAQQASELKAFCDAQGIPADEPVLFAGDLNVDMVLYPEEAGTLFDTLGSTLPRLVGTQRYTSDPSTNVLVGRDGGADSCSGGYEQSWGSKTDEDFLGITYTYNPREDSRVPCTNRPDQTQQGGPLLPFFRQSDTDHRLFLESGDAFCPCCPHEWLDYILVSSHHQQPTQSPTLECVALKAGTPITIPWSGLAQPWARPGACTRITLSDLSDHYPVIGRFSFPT